MHEAFCINIIQYKTYRETPQLPKSSLAIASLESLEKGALAFPTEVKVLKDSLQHSVISPWVVHQIKQTQPSQGNQEVEHFVYFS
jgi:hypothetical protein